MSSSSNRSKKNADEQEENATSFTADDTRATLRTLSSTIHDANSLPSGDSRDVALLTSPPVAKNWNSTVQRLESLLNAILVSSGSSIPPETASDEDEDAIRMRISDVLDESLERAHTALDTVEGFRDTPLADAEARADADAVSTPVLSVDTVSSKTNRLPRNYKPQRNFPDYPIDNSHNPFIPPYSKMPVPVPTPLPEEDAFSSASESSLDAKKRKRFKRARQGPHPYQKEIDESVLANSTRVFDEDSVQVYRGFKKTTFTFVDSVDGLMNCTNKLRNCTEIAVDLEAHNERSFLGFTCLMQISTRLEDFIIDVLVLRGSIHSALAPVFTDPNILKVMHGADNDVEWLERDFGIYVVNFFDTGQASKALYPLASLSYLLTKFCDVQSPNKRKFQRADWRKRPLPANMLAYARSDTHYLLYIADRLHEELSKKKDKIKEVYEKSGEVCTRRFSKPFYKPNQAMGLAAKHGLGFDVQQVCVLQALCKWRDDTARKEDESVQYVLTNRVMFDIAATKEKATTPAGVVKALKGKYCPLVLKYKVQIAKLIKDTREAPIEEKVAQKIKKRMEKSAGKKKRNNTAVRTVAVQTVEKQVVDSQDERSEGESSTPTTSEMSDVKTAVSIPIPKKTVVTRAAAKSRSSLFAEDSDSSDDSDLEEVVAKVLHNARTISSKDTKKN